MCTIKSVFEAVRFFWVQLDLSPYYVKAAKENMDYFYGKLFASHVPLGRFCTLNWVWLQLVYLVKADYQNAFG